MATSASEAAAKSVTLATPEDENVDKQVVSSESRKTHALTTVSDPDAPKEWEARGTVLSIVIGVLATCGSHVVYLVAMFAMMKSSRLISCSRAEYPALGFYGAYVCNYTKAYLECFPELALTICLLIVGRNLLQQRLFYGFLMRGAVLQYKSKSMFQDGMLRIFLWCYANAMMHLVLILWLIHQGGGDRMFEEELKETKGGTKRDSFLGVGSRGFSGHQFLGSDDSSYDAVSGMVGDAFSYSGAPVHPLHDPVLKKQIQTLVELIGFFFIPATLFLIYLFTGYDIEGSLVPLSQYFYDARNQAKKDAELGWASSASCDLTVLDDDATKLLIEHHQNAIHDAADTVNDAIDEIIDIYAREGADWEAKVVETGQSFNGIAKAHWPCRLLISEDATGISHGAFRTVWLVFIAISLTGQTFMMMSLSRLVVRDWNLYHEAWHYCLHGAVVLGNMCVEVYGISVNASTVIQWLVHDQFRKRDQEKNYVSIQRKAKKEDEEGAGSQAEKEERAAGPTGVHGSALSGAGVLGVMAAVETGAVKVVVEASTV